MYPLGCTIQCNTTVDVQIIPDIDRRNNFKS